VVTYKYHSDVGNILYKISPYYIKKKKGQKREKKIRLNLNIEYTT
jgi:hypothetical protein